MGRRQVNYDNDKQLTAQRLKEAINDAGLTASELAEKSHVSKSSVSQYVHATQSPSNISATAMAKVLGVSPMWLMGFNVPKSRVEYLNSKHSDDAFFNRIFAYAQLSMKHCKVVEVYDKLPPDGKLELLMFLDYMINKYDVKNIESDKDEE